MSKELTGNKSLPLSFTPPTAQTISHQPKLLQSPLLTSHF
jgi:hypothetical protein